MTLERRVVDASDEYVTVELQRGTLYNPTPVELAAYADGIAAGRIVVVRDDSSHTGFSPS